jgi:2-hydroxychromene-2-carboxylate isomerase
MTLPQRAQVDFYLDFSCPWSYLAMVRLGEAALRTRAVIRWCPVDARTVLAQANPQYPADRIDPNPRRAAWQATDLVAWARYCGLRLGRPSAWPGDSAWALRGAVVAIASQRIAPYAEAVFSAYFGEGRDIADPDVVIAAAEVAGLAPGGFSAALREPSTATAIAAHGQELLDRGGFGVPSFYVAGQLYFGNDRMPLVEMALNSVSDFRLIAPGQHGV